MLLRETLEKFGYQVSIMPNGDLLVHVSGGWTIACTVEMAIWLLWRHNPEPIERKDVFALFKQVALKKRLDLGWLVIAQAGDGPLIAFRDRLEGWGFDMEVLLDQFPLD